MRVPTLVLKQAAPVASIAIEDFLCSLAELVTDLSTGLCTCWSLARIKGERNDVRRTTSGAVPHFNVTNFGLRRLSTPQGKGARTEAGRSRAVKTHGTESSNSWEIAKLQLWQNLILNLRVCSARGVQQRSQEVFEPGSSL